MPASGTGCTFPPFASRNTACWLTLLAAVEPMAMTVPPGATVAAEGLAGGGAERARRLPGGPGAGAGVGQVLALVRRR